MAVGSHGVVYMHYSTQEDRIISVLFYTPLILIYINIHTYSGHYCKNIEMVGGGGGKL